MPIKRLSPLQSRIRALTKAFIINTSSLSTQQLYKIRNSLSISFISNILLIANFNSLIKIFKNQNKNNPYARKYKDFLI